MGTLNRYRAPLLICLIVLGLRLSVIGAVGLGDSEAYYWTWSQNLALSYFDHPPAVAYLIRAGTGLFGDTPFGVRITATLLTTATLFVVYLAGEAAAGAAAGLLSMGVLLSMPLFIVGSVAAAPDAGLSLCTALAVLFYVKARKGGDRGEGAVNRAPARAASVYVMLAGLFFGLGFLSKYSAVMLLPGVVAALALPHNRGWFKRPALYGGMALCLLMTAPVVAWNLAHGWSTVGYHFVSRQGGAGLSLSNLGKLVGGQLGYFSPFCMAGFAWSSWRAWRFRRGDPLLFEIALVGLPAALFFYLVILVTPNAEPHWPLVGYLPLAVVLGGAVAQVLAGGGRNKLQALAAPVVRPYIIVSLAFSLFVAIIAHVHILTPIFVRVMPASYNPKFDLVNELYGWDAAGARIETRHAAMGGNAPFLLGYHYTFCSQLMFATGGRIETRCLNRRTDEFDFLPGAEGPFMGRDFLFVRDNRYRKAPGELFVFDRCDPDEKVIVERGGRRVREFELFTCRGYRGLK